MLKKISITFSKIKAVQFLITEQCNLNCKYCFNKNRSENKIHLSLQQMNHFIKFFLSKSKSNKFMIQYFGGEPLLFWDDIKKSIVYLKKINRNKKTIQIRLTTNGLLLNKEIINFIKKNKMIVQLSIDDITNPKNERTSNIANHNILISKLETIKKMQAQKYFLIYSVLTPLNVSNYSSHVKYMHQKFGFNYYDFSKAFYYKKWRKKDFQKLKSEINSLKNFPEVKNKRIIIGKIQPSKIFICSPFNYKICVSPEGNLYPCDLIYFYKNIRRRFLLPLTGYINLKNKTLNNLACFIPQNIFEVNNYKCITCKANKTCSICPINNYKFTKSFYKLNPEDCRFYKACL